MAKDYAKATFNSTRARRKQRSKRILIVLILVLVSLGVSSGWFVYQYKMALFNKENMMGWMKDLKTLIHRQDQKTQVLAANQHIKKDLVSTVNPDPPVRFDFYTELPAMQVNVPTRQDEVDANTTKTIKSADAEHKTSEPAHVLGTPAASHEGQAKPIDHSKPDVQYIVQVGAYKKDSTASEMRVSILLAGFDAKVIKTTIGDHVIYRIQQGPYSSLDRAKVAQKKLQAKGFDGVVQKIN